MAVIIKAENLRKSYDGLQVLKGVNLEVLKGEIVSVVGASGAGKSTLLHIVGTLDKPDSGTLLINNAQPLRLSDKKLSAFRNNEIGFIFQFHHLLPEFTAIENIMLPGLIAQKPEKELKQKAHELLNKLKLYDRAGHKPNQLSGGEQQRIAVARALINSPSIVLADEPSGNLDSQNAVELHKLFFDLRESYNQTFIIVTHNEELAGMADRKLHIVDGIFV